MNSQPPGGNERFEQLVQIMKEANVHYRAYHSHKELLAHAVITIELTFVAFLISTSRFMPAWLCDSYWSSGDTNWSGYLFALYIGIFGVLLLVAHEYLLLQLRLRRVAGVWCTATGNAFWTWLQKRPGESEMNSLPRPPHFRPERARLAGFVDQYVFPFLNDLPSSDSDDAYKNVPACLYDFLRKVPKSPGVPERMLSATSLLVLVVSLFTLVTRYFLISQCPLS